MALNAFSVTNFPLDIVYSTGVIFSASAKLGATSGPPKFVPNTTYDNIDFDGKYTSVAGLDRIMHGDAVLSCTMLEMGQAATGSQITVYQPGEALVSVTALSTHTPAAGGTLVAAGSLIADFRVIWERGSEGSGNYFAVYMPFALCTKFGVDGQDKKNALIPVEFTSRLTSGLALNIAPYKLEFRTTLP